MEQKLEKTAFMDYVNGPLAEASIDLTGMVLDLDTDSWAEDHSLVVKEEGTRKRGDFLGTPEVMSTLKAMVDAAAKYREHMDTLNSNLRVHLTVARSQRQRRAL